MLNRSINNLAIILFMLAASNLYAAGEHCTSAYQVNSHTVQIIDPAGEQTAQFDLSRGAILTSLVYQGVNYVTASTTDAGAQVILRGSNALGGYTPTMGGNSAGRGSVATGVACSANHLWLTSGMTDNSNNAGASTAVVFKGSQWYFDQYIGTYVVSTYAYFIPNPNNTPHYYLKIDRTISNIDSSTDIDAPETYSFTFDVVTAVPTQFSYLASAPSCPSYAPCGNATSYIVSGLYAAGLTNGLATAVFPSTDWAGQSGSTYIGTESLTDRNVLHLNRTAWTVAPQTSKTYSQYLMVGPWANASAFAANVCTYSVSTPVNQSNVPVGGTTSSISVTTNGACKWEAVSDQAWLTISPVSGTGSGTVTYTISTNTSGVVRRANIHVAGRVFAFFQQAQ